MTNVVGVELTPDTARAAVIGRWRSKPDRFLEVAWDATRPEELVELLRSELGPTGRVALSAGLGFLHLKQVRLPPLPTSERLRILSLEPDRFFPVQGESLLVSLAEEGDLAFALDEAVAQRWVAAFEAWAPVDSVEAAPLSLARALGRGGEEGCFAVHAGPGERGMVEVSQGRVTRVRRALAGVEAPEASALPEVRGVPGEFLAALGAAWGVEAPTEGMLLSDAHRSRVRARRRRRLVVAGLACALSLGLALWSVDRGRERVLTRVRSELAAAMPRARGALELQRRLASLDREAATVGELARSRPDPLRVLAALGESLPADVTVLGARARGADWEIEGTAADAAAIVPLLDRDARFEDVRFLSASSRYREGGRTYETFSIAFRARANP